MHKSVHIQTWHLLPECLEDIRKILERSTGYVSRRRYITTKVLKTSGYVYTLAGGAISWKSSKQSLVAASMPKGN
jgi:hypothetical protein